MKSILTRRTIRKYANRDISDELLERLLTQAARTQTMGNLQLYSVVVTRSEEMKQKLAPAHFNQPMVSEAPIILTICAYWVMEKAVVMGLSKFLVNFHIYHFEINMIPDYILKP